MTVPELVTVFVFDLLDWTGPCVVKLPTRHDFKIVRKKKKKSRTLTLTLKSVVILTKVCDTSLLFTETLNRKRLKYYHLSWILMSCLVVNIYFEFDNNKSVDWKLSIRCNSTKYVKCTIVFNFVLHSRGKGLFKRHLYQRIECDVKVLLKILELRVPL